MTLDPTLRREIMGLLLVAIGGVTLLSLLNVTGGALSATWTLFLRSVFGWGAYPGSVVLVVAGLALLWEDLRKRISIPAYAAVGLELLFLALLGLSHLPVGQEKSLQVAARGGGGGYIGWTVSYFLATAVGRMPAFFILLLLALLGLGLFLSLFWDELKLILDRAGSQLRELSAPRAPAVSPPEEVAQRARLRPPKKVALSPESSEPTEAPKAAPAAPPAHRRRDRGLPSLNLLNGGGNEPYGDADVRYKRQVIEETLASFGVPAKVVEVNQGPTVTQFGVEPGFLEFPGQEGNVRMRKVKVSKIMALQDDLALALAASPIRIEAPVPGRSVVGIEVPNSQVAMVNLRNVMESRAMRDIDSRLRIALGQNVSGQPVAADLAQMPHLLIAGATGSGKSVCINAITACLLFNNTPDDLRLVMVDPKMVELTTFNGIPHLLGKVIIDVEEVVQALRWVTAQMDARYKLFSQAQARNIEAYNRMMASQGQQRLPYIVMLIDELADLMMAAPDEVERRLCRIAQMARATGIHLVIATQRPSVDVVTGLIKANFPARISFQVTTQVDSRVILDTGGAEKLLGRGDMLYMSSDSSRLVRLQGCFVSDEELGRLVRFWSDKLDWVTPQPASAPWRDMPLDEGDEDDLLEQATALARERDSISTSYIQRRLRIGYPRAAHLVDLLEAQGIVGSAENGGRSRKVLPAEDGQEPGESDVGEEVPW